MNQQKPQYLGVLGQTAVAALEPTNRAAFLDVLNAGVATVAVLGNGQLRLARPGPTAGVLETSTNLATNSWPPAGSPVQQPDGSWRFDAAPTEPVRFYRVRVLP